MADILDLVSESEDPLISLEDLQLYLRADCEDEAPLVAGIGVAAEGVVALLSGRVLRESVYTWTVEHNFPSGVFSPLYGYGLGRAFHATRPHSGGDALRVAKAPLLAITSVEYVDASGTTQTLAPTEYRVIRGSQNFARLLPKTTWPLTSAQPYSLKITLSCGYTPESLPKTIRQAILMVASDLYIHREAASELSLKTTDAVRNLLATHGLVRVA